MNANTRKATRHTVLSPRQEAAALALASGSFIGYAAKEGKCSPQTVKKWLREVPLFRRQIEQFRAEATERALGILSHAVAEASLKLVNLMKNSPDERIQLRAAESLLANQLHYQEQIALTERLKQLEDQLAAQTMPARARVA